MTSAATTRPAGVTVVAVLAWVSGALSILTGILILTGVTDVAGATPSAAWVAIVIGVVTILVSLGLFRGSNTARIITAIVFVLNLASAVFLLATHGIGNVTAILSGAAALVGLILLFTARANEFFRR